MLLSIIDWTAIIIAAIGLATAIVGAWTTIRTKRIELRAAEDARRAAASAQAAKGHADSVILRVKPKTPPETPPAS